MDDLDILEESVNNELYYLGLLEKVYNESNDLEAKEQLVWLKKRKVICNINLEQIQTERNGIN